MKKNNKIINEIITYFELGLPSNEICDLIGLTPEEFVEYLENEKIRRAKKCGSKKANIKVIEALLKACIGYKTTDIEEDTRYDERGNEIFSGKRKITKEVGPNINAIKFYLENRDSSWKDSLKETENKLNIKITVEGTDIIVSKESE